MTELVGSILISPVFVAIMWPLIFVIIEAASIIMLSDETVSKGEQKYRVFHSKSENSGPEHSKLEDSIQSTAPVSIEEIVKLAKKAKIVEIARLTDRRLDMFSFGIDLCVGALTTDLSLAFAASTVNSTVVKQLISLVVVHFLIYVFVLFLLKFSESHTLAIWSTNVMGVFSIVGLFIFVGGQIIQ